MPISELESSTDKLKKSYIRLLHNAYFEDKAHEDTATVTLCKEELDSIINSWHDIISKISDENEKEKEKTRFKKIADMLTTYMEQNSQNALTKHENIKRILHYLKIFSKKEKLPPVEFIEYYTKESKYIDPQNIDILLSAYDKILSNSDSIVQKAIELIKYSSMALSKTSYSITRTPTTILAKIIEKICSIKLDEAKKIRLINAFTTYIKIRLENEEEETEILYGIFDIMEAILAYIELDQDNFKRYINYLENIIILDNYPEINKLLKPTKGQKCSFDNKANSIFHAHEIIKEEYANILYAVQNYLLGSHFINEELLAEKFTNAAQIINMARTVEEANLIANIIIDNPDFEDKEIEALVKRTIKSTDTPCENAEEETYSIIFEISSMLTELEKAEINNEEKERYKQIFENCITLFKNPNVDSNEKQKKLRIIAKIICKVAGFNASLLENTINHIIQSNTINETVIYGIDNLIENSDLFEIEDLKSLIEYLIDTGELTLYSVQNVMKKNPSDDIWFMNFFHNHFEETNDKNHSYISNIEEIPSPTAEHFSIGGDDVFDTMKITVYYCLKERDKNKDNGYKQSHSKVRKLLIINLNNNKEG